MSKQKKKYLMKVYSSNHTLLKTYEYDTLKEAREKKASLHRIYSAFKVDIVSVELPVIPLQH